MSYFGVPVVSVPAVPVPQSSKLSVSELSVSQETHIYAHWTSYTVLYSTSCRPIWVCVRVISKGEILACVCTIVDFSRCLLEEEGSHFHLARRQTVVTILAKAYNSSSRRLM